MAINLFPQKNLKFGNKNTASGLKIIKLFFVFIGISLSLNAFAEVSIKSDFNYLNQLRQQVGLNKLTWNEQLAKAAQNHANYLSINNQHGHYEQQGQPQFSGEWVSDRAIAVNYANRMVSENVTSKSGDNLFYNPIDSLMSAIYHRFGFLQLNINELGIGHQTGRINSYVYVMGDAHLSQLCQQPSFTGNGEYNFKICAQADKRIQKSLVDNNKRQLQKMNAKIVLWPANKATQVSPVFFEESPDPLPSHSVSGYPISVQFNPAFFSTAPKVTAFSVQKTANNKAVKIITHLNKSNDPNQQLNAFQHALFPSERLEWATDYTAKLSYFDNDKQSQHDITWSFKTKSFDAPIITVTSQKTIKVKSGQRYILYFPPRHAHDIQAALNYREQQMNLKLNYIDNNTLNAFITYNGKAEITFHQKTIKLMTE